MTKPAVGGGVEPALDQVPRLEIVGQRERAEVMAERRADPGGHRQHRGDAGDDGEVERAPGRPGPLRSPRTPPPPWRTRRDRRRRRPRRSRPAPRGAARPRRGRPPRGCRRHGAPGRRARERGRDRGRSRRCASAARKRRAGLRGEPARVARAEADDGEMPAHDRALPARHQHDGEIGRASSVLSASGITIASVMVPRST